MKDQFPVFRMLYIILARLHRWSGNLNKAIETLPQFLGQKGKDGSGNDKDATAALYNRACYYEYRLEAARDPDFSPLANDDDFKRLTA